MKKNINKNKGFTLVELLVTILIISNIINSSKETSDELSINNIKNSARTYSKEYPDNLIWKEDGENYYACITIQDLINAGYYKKEQLPKKLNGKSIILTKNSSNTIINEELDETNSCSLPSTQYAIKFNGNGATNAEDVITEDVICTRGEYCTLTKNKFIRTGYKFVGWAISASGKVLFDDNEKVKDIAAKNSSLITLYAVWKPNNIYIRYHINGGIITSETTNNNGEINKWTTTQDGIIRKNDKAYYTAKYGETLVYGLADYNSKTNIYITKDYHHAKVREEWCTKANGTGTCYNHSAKLENIGSIDSKSKKPVLCDARTKDCTIDVYVNWVPNKVYFRFHPNGGTVRTPTSNGSETYRWTTDSEGFLKVNGAYWGADGFNYNKTLGQYGFPNWNNASYLYISKTGYIGATGKEWCKSDGDCYSHDQDYKMEQFCKNIKTLDSDCIVKLYVHWQSLVAITCQNKTYNGRSQTIASCSGGTISNHNQTNVGSYTVKCIGDANHGTATKSCSITKAASIITCQNKTYNGKSQTIASCSGGTISNHNKINAGTYIVTCRGDANHTTTTKNCSISKTKATITCQNKLYNGSKQTIASCSGGTISNNKKTKVGSYKVTCKGDANHTNADSKTCKISKSDAKITFSPNGGSYQSSKQVSVSCSATSGVKSFTAKDDSGDTGSKNKNTISITLSSTGSRTITATCTSKGGGKTTASKSFTITSPPSSDDGGGEGSYGGGGSSCSKWCCTSHGGCNTSKNMDCGGSWYCAG